MSSGVGAAGGCTTRDQMGLGIWGLLLGQVPHIVIVLEIYEVNVRQILRLGVLC